MSKIPVCVCKIIGGELGRRQLRGVLPAHQGSRVRKVLPAASGGVQVSCQLPILIYGSFSVSVQARNTFALATNF